MYIDRRSRSITKPLIGLVNRIKNTAADELLIDLG